MRRLGLILLVWVVASVAAPAAWAHRASVSYSQVQVGEDGTIDYKLRLSSRDLYEALELDRDRDATDEEIRAGAAALTDYVLARVHVAGGIGACPVEKRGLDIIDGANRFAEVRFAARCHPPLAAVSVDYDLFFDLDPLHTGMLQISHGGQTVDREFTKGSRRFEWALDQDAPGSLGLADYIGKGIEHIYTGYDHIAFIIGLLLVAVVKPRPGAKEVMEPRGLRAAIPYTVKIVTAFTIAHSFTLILAALDVITLPSRAVESAIALSILYVAMENVMFREPPHRWSAAFLFGLVHGLGFAAMLRPILPSGGVIVPLLAFNVGVEIGQLSIVAALLPILHLAARRDASAYRRWVVLGGSGLVGLFGLLWFVERVFDVRLFAGVLGG